MPTDGPHALDASGKRSFGPEAEALLPILENYTKASPDAIYKGSPFIDPDGRLRVDQLLGQVAWMQKEGLVEAGLDPMSFIDLGFIDGHYGVPGN